MCDDDRLARYATIADIHHAYTPAETDEDQAYFLCACYGVLCLRYALAMHRITESELVDIRTRVARDASIPSGLVRKAFPKPFEQIANMGLPITLRTMSDYWHGHAGPSPVLPCTAEHRLHPNGTSWRVRFDTNHAGLFRAECPRDTLHIENGARMWAHVAYDTHGNIRKIIIPEHIV